MNEEDATNLDDTLKKPTPSLGWAFAWALFLGVSWTWCIGMFLPVLLVRDFGPIAWFIFAIPNCLGAAAMGWVLHDASASRAFVQRHRRACEAFSLVTMAFQIFFATWMLPQLVGPIGYLAPALMIQSAFTPIRSPRVALIASAIVYAISIAIALTLAAHGSLVTPEHAHAFKADLAGLAGICLLGFIFSPYLDLTFHQARQATTVQGGRFAFGVGFCVIFASMIVLSFFYADTFKVFIESNGLAASLIAIHLGVQMLFTVNVHAAALRESTAKNESTDTLAFPILALSVACAFALGLVGHIDRVFHGMPIGEVIYRCFLTFYGLATPAYLITTRGRKPLTLCVLTIILATPSLYMAFLSHDMKWALMATLIVLVAGMVANAQPPRERVI